MKNTQLPVLTKEYQRQAAGMIRQYADKLIQITQVELAYTDYDPADGSVIQTGSEDFSLERYKQELTSKYCYTWNGEDRTEEGYRHFVAHGHFLFRKADLILLHRYLKIKFPKEKRIELRF
mgnify:CR=1 FL=1